MPSNSTGSATVANVSGVAESRVTAEHLALMIPVHSVTFCHANLLPSSRSIAESAIPVNCWKAAVVKPGFTVGEPDLRNLPLFSDCHMTWLRYPMPKISYEMLEEQNAANRGLLQKFLPV